MATPSMRSTRAMKSWLVAGVLTGILAWPSAAPSWALFRGSDYASSVLQNLADLATPPEVVALKIGSAYRTSDVAFALLKAGILDALDDDAKTCGDLATNLQLHRDFVCRYMNAGVSIGVLWKKGDKFRLSRVGRAFTFDVRHMVELMNSKAREAERAASLESMATGKSGTRLFHHGDLDGYDALKTYDDLRAEFDLANKAMIDIGKQSATAVLAAYQVPPTAELCDVGGGEGQLVAEFALRWPETTATVFDLAETANSSRSYLGSRLPPDRFRFVPGSFFEPYPPTLASCDVFFYRHILHDWPDADARRILHNLNAVAKPGSKLVVIEFILDDNFFLQSSTAKRFMDITMLALNAPGAKERSLSEFIDLFNLSLVGNKATTPRLIPTCSLYSILEISL